MRLRIAPACRSRLSAVALLLLGGCGGGGDGPTGGTHSVASVRLTTPTRAIGVGGTTTVSVEALSANGTRIAAVQPAWTIAPLGAASFVGTPGATATVRGDQVGTVTVRAVVQGLFADVTIQVGPPTVARVEITAPPGIVVGQEVQLTARTIALNDSVLTDRVVRWSTSDPSLVRIDSVTGLAVALGAGSARIRARSEGVTGEVTLVVSAPQLRGLTRISAGLAQTTATVALEISLQLKQVARRRMSCRDAPTASQAAAVSPPAARMAAASTPCRSQNASYALGRISLGLISLRPPQNTFV